MTALYDEELIYYCVKKYLKKFSFPNFVDKNIVN